MKHIAQIFILLFLHFLYSYGQGIATPPYSCDFENAMDRSQWVFLNGSQTNRWYIDTATSNGGRYSLYVSRNSSVHEYTSMVASQVWVYRQIALPAGLYDITYDWVCRGYSTYHYMVAFLVPASSFTGTAGSGTGFPGGSPGWIPINPQGVSGSIMNGVSTWQNTYLANINVPTTQLYYLVFGWTNTSVNTSGVQPPAAIDNINIVAATCPRPSSLSVTTGNTQGSVAVSWTENGTATNWVLEYSTTPGFRQPTRILLNTTNTTANGSTITYAGLMGLQPSTSYYFRIRSLCSPNDSSIISQSYIYRFCTGSTGCIDFTNLRGPGVVCTYGKYQYYGQYTPGSNYGGPYADTGVVDLGPGSYGRASGNPGSRHTVNRDPSTRDPLCPQIMRIPPNECQSVRLGSYYGGYICQSVSYRMVVDTAVADILLFKYACVFNDVNHGTTQQPRFVLEILDSSGTLINPTCGSANYSATDVSSGSVGGTWYTVTGPITLNDTIIDPVTGAVNCTTMTYSTHIIRARDWTPLGLNISPYHGQNITIRVTSFSCGQSGPNHCGYVYYTLGCSKGRITSTACGGGSMNTTLTAPSGFTYRWYTANNPRTTISTQQTVTVQLDSTMYYCDVRFVDDTDCYFTISTLATLRYPRAAFTGSINTDSCIYRLHLRNMSYITTGPHDTSHVGQCENFLWDFGDGRTSTSENPVVEYPGPGTYTVKLITGINNMQCIDTMTHTFTFRSPASGRILGPRRICHGDTALFRTSQRYVEVKWSTGYGRDSLYVSPDTSTEYSVAVVDSIGCKDTLRAVVRVIDCNIFDTTCCNSQYVGYGFVIPTDTARSYAGITKVFQRRMRSYYGTDSTSTLHLTILDTSETIIYDTFCQGLPYSFQNISLTRGGYYNFHHNNIYGCDSVIHLYLHELPPPVINVWHSYVKCLDYPITIIASHDGDVIEWGSSPEDTSLSGQEHNDTITVRPAVRTTYTVRTSRERYGCSTQIPIVINTESNLEAHIHSSSQSASFSNMQVIFTDASTDNTWRRWYLNDYNYPVGTDENYIYTFDLNTDTVHVILVVGILDTKCMDTAEVIIPFFGGNIWVPNAFTPDEDINKVFCVYGEVASFHMDIYNRRGVLVYTSDDIEQCWDGSGCAAGVYVYHIRYISPGLPDNTHVQVGAVILIR